MAITAVRSIAIQGLLVFNGYVASLELDEESDDEDDKKPEFEAPSLEEFSSNCTKSFLKSLSITTSLRSLEFVSIRIFHPQIVGKLIKDVSRSAVRKFMRTSSKITTAKLILKTGMRSNILSHIAIFLIEETQQIAFFLWHKYRSTYLKKPLKDEEKVSFVSITTKNATRLCMSIITGGIGAAIGTSIRPGLGTTIGATIGDTISYAL